MCFLFLALLSSVTVVNLGGRLGFIELLHKAEYMRKEQNSGAHCAIIPKIKQKKNHSSNRTYFEIVYVFVFLSY